MITSTDIAPFVETIGGGFAAGAILGYAIKQVLKIVAVVVGLFIASLTYLQYQGIIDIDWSKLQTISQNGLTTVANTIMNISNNPGANHSTATLSGLIPLTSSASAGFILGLVRGNVHKIILVIPAFLALTLLAVNSAPNAFAHRDSGHNIQSFQQTCFNDPCAAGYTDGENQAYADWSSQNNNPSCPREHSNEYCSQYWLGYNDE
jgi:uncharacterized membrane protein (Fun14 family)